MTVDLSKSFALHNLNYSLVDAHWHLFDDWGVLCQRQRRRELTNLIDYSFVSNPFDLLAAQYVLQEDIECVFIPPCCFPAPVTFASICCNHGAILGSSSDGSRGFKWIYLVGLGRLS